jgi:hypothetical protein
VFGHPVHVAPPVPHSPAVSEPAGTHVPVTPPLQQPPGHDVPLQMHWPAVLSVDVSHTRFAPHEEQVAPAVPHEVELSDAQGSHVPVGPPLQQPFGHDVASHTHWPVDLLHSSPVLQPPQVAPPAPQDALLSLDRASHAVPLQQPAHVPPPHEHAPFEHA